MPKITAFDKLANEYDDWFERHDDLFMAEFTRQSVYSNPLELSLSGSSTGKANQGNATARSRKRTNTTVMPSSIQRRNWKRL